MQIKGILTNAVCVCLCAVCILSIYEHDSGIWRTNIPFNLNVLKYQLKFFFHGECVDYRKAKKKKKNKKGDIDAFF